jgi:putative two-component system response regulator
MPTNIDNGTIYLGRNIQQIIKSLPVHEAQHMCRVGTLVGIMSPKIHELGSFLKDSDLDEYSYFSAAATYHDIGKVWVPRYILEKPSQLTEDETNIVKKHPIFACELFKLIQSGSITGMPKHLFQLAFNSAAYHHEWWNGKGYPYGIGSDDIPLIARITSICDAYDAITSERPYRKARSHYDACNELKKNAGTQFDPLIVKVFLDNEDDVPILLNEPDSCL